MKSCQCFTLAGLLVCLFIMPVQAEEVSDIIFHRRAELMKKAPNHTAPGVKVWRMRQDERSRTNLVELRGDLKRHLHPDARHTIMVVEGEIWFRAGDAKKETLLIEGDFVSIGAGVPHKYRVKSERALIVSFDAPAYDSKKTVILE